MVLYFITQAEAGATKVGLREAGIGDAHGSVGRSGQSSATCGRRVVDVLQKDTTQACDAKYIVGVVGRSAPAVKAIAQAVVRCDERWVVHRAGQ